MSKESSSLQENSVASYYESWESRLGYRLFLHGEKHLGWHEDGIPIPDSEARERTVDVVANRLNLKYKSGLLLLDAGAGLGGPSRHIARSYNAQVEGISVVPFEVKSAQKKVAELACNYHLMSYDNLKFDPDYFDGVYTIETLSHAKDVSKVFSEFYRVLKPGGRIAFFEYTMAPDERFSAGERKISDFAIKTGALWGMYALRHGEFEENLKQQGFEDITVETRTKEVLPSLQRLHKYAHPASVVLKKLGIVGPFRNTLVADDWHTLFEKDLWRLVVVSAQKPGRSNGKT